MPGNRSALPDLTRPDAGAVLVGRWSVDTPERRRAAGDAVLAAWESVPRPDGLLSFHCLTATDGDTLLTYAQWTDAEAQRRFARTQGPALARSVDAAVPGLRRPGPAHYRLYRGIATGAPGRTPGSIAVITFDTDGPQWQRRLVDSLMDDHIAHAEPHPRMISVNFHLGTDGARVFNYSQWEDEEAHREVVAGALREGDPVPRMIAGMAGVRPLGFERYVFHGGLAAPAAPS